MDILFVQHGDYGLAYKSMLTYEKETYRDQFRSVRFVADLSATHTIRVLSFCTRPHREQLTANLWSIGVKKGNHFKAQLDNTLASFNTDLLVCRTPHRQTLNWAATNRILTLPCFADTFSNDNLRSRLRNLWLGHTLKKVLKPCVANHSLNASQSLTLLGICPTTIIPWDWSPLEIKYIGKPFPDKNHTFSIMYIGVLSRAKGLDTAIDAISNLKAKGIKVILNIAGQGDLDYWRGYTKQQGVSFQVNFLGTIPSDSVLHTMNANDAIIVPSKHEYPEGLPNTIYEALASRSPLIISDHPAFAGRLREDIDCLSFTANSAASLASRILDLKTTPNLYKTLSDQSINALQSLYIGSDWCDLIKSFIDDPENKGDWTKTVNLEYIQQHSRQYNIESD